MGKISGLKSKMSAGRINPGVYQMTETSWAEKESRNGNLGIYLCQKLIDLDGMPHDLQLFALNTTAYGTTERVVEVNDKGQLDTVSDNATVQFNRNMGAGKYLDSLNDRGFSPKKLDDVDLKPSGLDGQWVRIAVDAATSKDGKEFNEITVAELLDGPPKGKGGGGSGKSNSGGGNTGSASSSTSKKTSKPVVEEEPDEDESEPDESEDEEKKLDADDDEIAAAVGFVQELIASPDTFVKNFDEDANAGGVTFKQANTAVWSKFKGKGNLKGTVGSLVGDPLFHELHADGWGYSIDEDDSDKSVILPLKKKKAAGRK